MEFMILIAVAVLAVGLDWLKERLCPVDYWQEDENMPRDLRKATLYGSEFPVTWQGVNGIVDQAYTTSSGALVLLDTKRRREDRVRMSDIWQLSLYRAILMFSKDVSVSTKGYVRVVSEPLGEGSQYIHYHAVTLYPIRTVQEEYGLSGPDV